MLRLRTLFISDFHLGTRGCQASLLLQFLRSHEAETIYLVGDIVDGWRLRRSWYWPASHNDIAQEILRKAHNGARVVYIPGNHDEFLRDYLGTHFGGIEVRNSAVHMTANGQRFLIIHGDQFDIVVRHARWLAFLGDHSYTAALALNSKLTLVRRKLGLSYWSLSAWAKLRVKNAVNFIGAFQDALVREARELGVDGVICGHIHHAASQQMHDVAYYNCGDWVESCTALVEHHDGRLEIVRWPECSDRSSQSLELVRPQRTAA